MSGSPKPPPSGGKASLSGAHTRSTTGPVRPSESAPPLRVVSVSPAQGSKHVAYREAISVRFSEPLAKDTAFPQLSPRPRGRWQIENGDTLVFDPESNYLPFGTERIVLPGGLHGLVGENGGVLRQPVTTTFAVAGASFLRLNQLLAELDYLPVLFWPSGSVTESAPGLGTGTGSSSTAGSTTTTTTTAPTTTTAAPTTTTAATTTTKATTSTHRTRHPRRRVVRHRRRPEYPAIDEPRRAGQISLTPQPGSFSWRFGNTPSSLSSLWSAREPNVVTTGAIMMFEDDHGLATDGVAGPGVWAALLKAVAARQVNRAPYAYVEVSESLPETVTLWVNGRVIFQTLCNTGIPEAPTALGTYPVYARYTVTTMSGTNPDGSHYSDPGIPWVSYFNGGDALHGFLRAGYGYPQSLGCVEMTYQAAATVWPWTPLGTLVTVM